MEREELRIALTRKVEECFKEKKIDYEYDEGNNCFCLSFFLDSGLENTDLVMKCLERGLSLCFTIPVYTRVMDMVKKVSKPEADEIRDQVMEFITRVDYDMFSGAFALNVDTDIMQFAIHLLCEEIPTDDFIMEQIVNGLTALNNMGDELVEVILGHKNAKDAVDALFRKASQM